MREFLLRGPLERRNEASIRYRMRNISSVFADRRWPILTAYTPATRVGTGVRARINAILDSYSAPALAFLTQQQRTQAEAQGNLLGLDQLRREAVLKLEELSNALRSFEGGSIGIGHNKPPEGLDEEPTPLVSVLAAQSDIQTLVIEIKADRPDLDLIEAKSHRVLEFGLRLSEWFGVRFTKLADAAMVSLGPIVVAKVTGVLPMIVDALANVARVVERLMQIN